MTTCSVPTPPFSTSTVSDAGRLTVETSSRFACLGDLSQAESPPQRLSPLTFVSSTPVTAQQPSLQACVGGSVAPDAREPFVSARASPLRLFAQQSVPVAMQEVEPVGARSFEGGLERPFLIDPLLPPERRDEAQQDSWFIASSARHMHPRASSFAAQRWRVFLTWYSQALPALAPEQSRPPLLLVVDTVEGRLA